MITKKPLIIMTAAWIVWTVAWFTIWWVCREGGVLVMEDIKYMTEEEVQEAIDLTPSQQKAWTQLVRAISRCKKENIYFYQVLESLNGLNGNNVKSIENVEYTCFDVGGPRDLNGVLAYPSVSTADAFADDTHVVILNGDTSYIKH